MEDFKNLQETQLSSQPIFDGDVLHIFKDTIRLPNGKQATREYTVHHGAVCILPLLENGDVLLEHQFRYPMGEVITEIPAGKLDYIGEDPASAALREMLRQTGPGRLNGEGIIESGVSIVDLSINVPNLAAAQSVCESWPYKYQNVYDKIMEELL